MFNDLILRLEDRFPSLARWLNERAHVQLPAWGASVVTHLLLLGALGMVGYAAHEQPKPPEFRTEVVDTQLSDFAKLDSAAVTEIDKTQMAPVSGSFGPTTTAVIVTPPPTENTAVKPPPPEINAPGIAKIASVALPAPIHLDRALTVGGQGAEHVGSVEGAVDRIAVEILRKMEGGRTLVVWAFDASGSLVAERERLNKYIDGVYEHVLQLDKENMSEHEGLLTAVVAFGKDRKVLTSEPTSDRAAVSAAIAAVPLDTTGVESTFQTVGEIAKKYGKFSKDKQPYQTMVIVVTDEVGDDEENLEAAIIAANSVKMPVYILGSPALFGRADGHMNYTDPKTKQTFYNLPVRQGPESVALEGIRLPFWYDGPQYDYLDAGFGPHALSRLAGATGGIYFVTRMGGNRITFDPAGMREYKPDWVSKEQYIAAVNKNPLRRAVMRASVITQQNLPLQPGLSYPAADGPEFKDAMSRNQEIVARIQYTVDEALGRGMPPAEPTIDNTTKRRDHETSRRWQAHYDLIRGRLLAMKTRCLEYNTACAKMKKDAPKFTKPNSNAWKMRPDEEVHLKGKDLADAKEAKELLERVVKDHPGTPWAMLAKRELKDPFGFRWEEVYVTPPKRMNDAPAAAAKKKAQPKPAMPGKPPEPPKL